MTREQRPSTTVVPVCDLCGDEIRPGGNREIAASITHGIDGMAPRFTLKTLWAWLYWPPPHWTNEPPFRAPDLRRVEWDFHAGCLVDTLRPIVEQAHERWSR